MEIFIFNNESVIIMPDEKLARAIRSRIRRDILQILCQNENISVHGIANKLVITESSASKHLKLLYDLGFVNSENKPPEKFYSLKILEMKELLEIYNKVVERSKEV
jgi:DNA-binding transcriptional ArsR family regulator